MEKLFFTNELFDFLCRFFMLNLSLLHACLYFFEIGKDLFFSFFFFLELKLLDFLSFFLELNFFPLLLLLSKSLDFLFVFFN